MKIYLFSDKILNLHPACTVITRYSKMKWEEIWSWLAHLRNVNCLQRFAWFYLNLYEEIGQEWSLPLTRHVTDKSRHRHCPCSGIVTHFCNPIAKTTTKVVLGFLSLPQTVLGNLRQELGSCSCRLHMWNLGRHLRPVPETCALRHFVPIASNRKGFLTCTVWPDIMLARFGSSI